MEEGGPENRLASGMGVSDIECGTRCRCDNFGDPRIPFSAIAQPGVGTTPYASM